MNLKKENFRFKRSKEVLHAKFNIENGGNLIMYLIPPKFSFKERSSTLILNNQNVIPVGASWYVIISNFMNCLNEYNKNLNKDEIKKIIQKTVNMTKMVYPAVDRKLITQDTKLIVKVFEEFAIGNTPKENIGQISTNVYLKNMDGPYLVNMVFDKSFESYNLCLNRENDYVIEKDLLDDVHINKVISKLKDYRVSQLNFVCNDNLQKERIINIINKSRWFYTMFSTSRVCFDEIEASKLKEFSLDQIDYTIYSVREDINRKIDDTQDLESIKKSIKILTDEGLNVHVKYPICKLNTNFEEMFSYLKSVNVLYVKICLYNLVDKDNRYSLEEYFELIKEAKEIAKKYNINIQILTNDISNHSFDKIEGILKLGCRPTVTELTLLMDGSILPCKSYISKKQIIGNVFKDNWKEIWKKSEKANNIRKNNTNINCGCPLDI